MELLELAVVCAQLLKEYRSYEGEKSFKDGDKVTTGETGEIKLKRGKKMCLSFQYFTNVINDYKSF